MSISKLLSDPLRVTKLADYDAKMRSNKIRDIQTDNFAATKGFAQNFEQNMVQVPTNSYWIKEDYKIRILKIYDQISNYTDRKRIDVVNTGIQ